MASPADIEHGRHVAQTVFTVAAVLYFLPTLVAIMRRVRWGGVLILNLLLGWTVLGWVVALVVACSASPRAAAPPLRGRLRDMPIEHAPPTWTDCGASDDKLNSLLNRKLAADFVARRREP